MPGHGDSGDEDQKLFFVQPHRHHEVETALHDVESFGVFLDRDGFLAIALVDLIILQYVAVEFAQAVPVSSELPAQAGAVLAVIVDFLTDRFKRDAPFSSIGKDGNQAMQAL